MAVLLLLALAAAVTYFNHRFAAGQPGGSDFIPRWLGTRLLLTQGLDPYGTEATLAIQQFFYDRPAPPEADQLLFVYPLYSVPLFAPFALIGDFALARAMWTTAVQAALILTAILGLQLVHWRPRAIVLTMLLVFGLLWYPAARAMINGNPAVMAALFTTAGLWAIRRERDLLAGLLFSLATIKPQMVVLLLPLVALWAYSVRRRTLLLSLVGSMLGLTLLATAVQPDWLLQNLRQVMSYPGYTPPGSPPDILGLWWQEPGRWLGWISALLLILALLRQWRSTWAASPDHFIWTALLTIAMTNLVGLRTATDNYVGLIAGLLFVFAYLDGWRQPLGRLIIVAALLLLFAGQWHLFLATVSGDYQHPIMFFPAPIFTVLGLSFVRPRRVSNPHLLGQAPLS